MVRRYEQMMLGGYKLFVLVKIFIQICASICDPTLFSISIQSLPL